MAEARRVLVVDDNIEFCRNVADILGATGHAVAIAHSGPKALEMAEDDGFEVVLVDVRMPGMDGVETFLRLKGIAPQAIVIVVTAFSVEDRLRQALREGAFGVMAKPLDFDRLRELIDVACRRGQRVLVVDDDAEFRASTRDILADHGYGVDTASDGNTALQKSRESKHDVALIDMQMPRLDGLETYLAVRSIRPDLAVIITTGRVPEAGGRVEQAVRQNAYAWMEKPLDFDRLFSLLGEIATQKAEGTPDKPG